MRHRPGGEEETEAYCYNAAGEVTNYSGPEAEPESSEGSEEQENIAYGTCYPAGEGPPSDCSLEDPPSEYQEVEEDPVATKYMGIADDERLSSYDIFKTSTFKELHVDAVRHQVPWNLVWEGEHGHHGNPNAETELTELRTWLKDAKEELNNKKGEAYISFKYCGEGEASKKWINPLTAAKLEQEHKPLEEEPCSTAPGWKEYEAAVKAFFEPYVVNSANLNAPLNEVENFTAWNEPNHAEEVSKNHLKLVSGEPSGRLAGEYWKVLDGICDSKTPKCKVAAGDFLDFDMREAKNKKSFGGGYLSAYMEGMERPASAERWAWHPYFDGEQAGHKFREPKNWWSVFKKFKSKIDGFPKKTRKPEIWITEAGVIFEQGQRRTPFYHNHTAAQHAMKAYMDYKTYQLTSQAQVTRFFYYAMRGNAEFDSGLAEPTSTEARQFPRQIYHIYKTHTPT